MRKFLLSILFFVLACANAWGAKYYYKSGIASCIVENETDDNGKTKFELTIDVRGLNGSTYASTLHLHLLSSDHTLEGTYTTEEDANDKITDETYLKYSSQKNRTPNGDSLSIITIEKIGAPDYCYRISGGKLNLKNADDNLYNYYFCYALDANKDVIENTLSHYDFGYIKYAVTGTSPNQTLTISGYGAMNNYSTTINAPWYSFKAGIKNVIIEDGVISVGEYAFYNCTTLVSITVPKSVTSFGSNAFHSCKNTQNIYYAGSPNQWAGITFSNQTAHPYGTTSSLPSGVAEARSYYFNGSNTATNDLVFAYGLTEIKAYTFCNAGTLNSVSIPSSVTNIRNYALASKFAEAYVNKATAPTLSNTIPISFTDDGVLYIPTGASGYNTDNYWVDHYSKNTQGASEVKQKPVSGTVNSQSWSLSSTGVLTIDGSGAITTTFADAEGVGVSQYPYYYFRFLVDKVVVTGGVTALSNFLQRTQAMRTIEFQQNNIPSTTTTTPTDYVYAAGTLKMVFPCAAVEEVNPTTWSIYKRQLSNTPTISDSEDQTSLIEALHDNLTEPFNLQLNRSLTNAQYNTFCSPIALTKDQLNDADIRALTGTSLDGDELTLTFSEDPLDAIEAGKPYLVKPSSAVANPTFEDIDPSDLVSATENTVTTYADFIGVLAPTALEENDKNTLFLGADNELFWPAEGSGNIKGMRAYFSIKGAARKAAKRARIVMNKEVTTDIETVSGEGLPVTGKKILRNGQLFIIRDNKTYNVLGLECGK